MKRSHACVGVLVSGLLQAGCGGSEPPGQATTGSASGGVVPGQTSTTSATTPAPPTNTYPESALVVPPEAKAHTSDGAKAFAAFYMELNSDAYVSLSVSPMQALAIPGCAGCRVLMNSVAKNKQRGRRALSRSLSVDMTQVRDVSPDGTSHIEVAGTERAVSLVDTTGGVVGTTSSGRVTFLAEVRWTANGWRMSDVKLVIP